MEITLQQWSEKGAYYQLPSVNVKVFYVDLGDKDAAAENTLLLFHGFPESSYSYHKVVDRLLQRFGRVVLLDFPGFGFSDKPQEGYSYSLLNQADTALAIWKHIGVTGGHLLAHDMGVSVATEMLARQNGGELPSWFSAGVQSITFTNGSIVMEFSKLRIAQKILLSPFGPLLSKLNNYTIFSHQVKSAHGTDGLSAQDIELLWIQVQHKGGSKISHKLIGYIRDRYEHEKSRWLPAVADTDLPVHICWGTADAVGNVAIAKYLKKKVKPTAKLSLMEGVGHFCQLSDPEIWLEQVLAFY